MMKTDTVFVNSFSDRIISIHQIEINGILFSSWLKKMCVLSLYRILRVITKLIVNAKITPEIGSGPDPSAILDNGEIEIGSLRKVKLCVCGDRVYVLAI